MFQQYVEDLYSVKCNAKNEIDKSISKSLLNNLLGRFGMNIIRPITSILDMNQLSEIIQTKK